MNECSEVERGTELHRVVGVGYGRERKRNLAAERLEGCNAALQKDPKLEQHQHFNSLKLNGF